MQDSAGSHTTRLLGAGVQTIRLRPALDVSIGEIELLLSILDRCLAGLRSR